MCVRFKISKLRPQFAAILMSPVEAPAPIFPVLKLVFSPLFLGFQLFFDPLLLSCLKPILVWASDLEFVLFELDFQIHQSFLFILSQNSNPSSTPKYRCATIYVKTGYWNCSIHIKLYVFGYLLFLTA